MVTTAGRIAVGNGFPVGWTENEELVYTATRPIYGGRDEMPTASYVVNTEGEVRASLPALISERGHRIDGDFWLIEHEIVDVRTGAVVWRVSPEIDAFKVVASGLNHVVVLDRRGSSWWTRWR